MTDDYTGYKKTFQQQGVTEVGCMAHARRKFLELHANSQSQIAEQALHYFGQLYDIEREAKTLTPEERRRLRQTHAKPIIDQLHASLLAQRLRVPDGSGIAKALDYSLTRYLDNGRLPIDNNHIENQIRPVALGRKNWLFAGSPAGWASRGGGGESDSFGPTERSRSACLFERCADQLANPSQQPLMRPFVNVFLPDVYNFWPFEGGL